jgi:hypothetical protein
VDRGHLSQEHPEIQRPAIPGSRRFLHLGLGLRLPEIHLTDHARQLWRPISQSMPLLSFHSIMTFQLSLPTHQGACSAGLEPATF